MNLLNKGASTPNPYETVDDRIDWPRRWDDHASDSLAVAGIVEGQLQQTWSLRIAPENAGNTLSSDCPAVKRGATCSPSIAVPAGESCAQLA